MVLLQRSRSPRPLFSLNWECARPASFLPGEKRKSWFDENPGGGDPPGHHAGDEPDGDKLQLIAAEWLIPLATGIKERPSVFGRPFDGPMHGHEPLMPKDLHHYDLHVWLWKENPAGLFSPPIPRSRARAMATRSRRKRPTLYLIRRLEARRMYFARRHILTHAR